MGREGDDPEAEGFNTAAGVVILPRQSEPAESSWHLPVPRRAGEPFADRRKVVGEGANRPEIRS